MHNGIHGFHGVVGIVHDGQSSLGPNTIVCSCYAPVLHFVCVLLSNFMILTVFYFYLLLFVCIIQVVEFFGFSFSFTKGLHGAFFQELRVVGFVLPDHVCDVPVPLECFSIELLEC